MTKPLATLALLLATTAQAAPDPTGTRWWHMVKVLADDNMEGRLTGTPGYQRAADYVASQFRTLGLKPAGDTPGSFFQTVRFVSQTIDQAQSSAALDGEPLRVGPDLLFSARQRQRSFDNALLVFAGYGLHAPEAGYDDFAGRDLRGKVIVVLNGGPASVPTAVRANAIHGSTFAPAMERAGAIGVITIANPKAMDIPWARTRLAASQPGMRLADPAFDYVKAPLFSALFNPAEADKLFAGSGHTLAEMLALADAHKPLPRFALAPKLTVHLTLTTSAVSSPNVAALLPGSDRKLAAQVVVISAHLDHLGVGEAIDGDRIYNGAMDNASGVASVIEAARDIAALPHRPRRSILFLAVCGEEKGLLGSRYFAERPTLPGVVADVNMDMFLPIYPLARLTAFGADQSSLGPVISAAARDHGVTLQPDLEPDRNLFIRSDQYSFIRTGVPALSMKFAAAPGSPEKATEAEWLRTRYHAPSDDTGGPVMKPAAAQFNAIMADLIVRIADADAKPAWNEGSFFQRFARRTGDGVSP